MTLRRRQRHTTGGKVIRNYMISINKLWGIDSQSYRQYRRITKRLIKQTIVT